MQQDLEGFRFGDVRQLDRLRTARNSLDVDDFRPADARPFGQDLADRRVSRDDRDASVLDLQLHVCGRGSAHSHRESAGDDDL